MRKAIMMLGTILIAAVILISGSAVAWVWVDNVHSYNNCTDPDHAVGAPDTQVASLGTVGPPPAMGWIFLDLGLSNAMPNSQNFTVFHYNNANNEEYNVSVSDTSDPDDAILVGFGWDQDDYTFTTPSSGGGAWRYILIKAYIGADSADPAPGPEIDAVGWDKP